MQFQIVDEKYSLLNRMFQKMSVFPHPMIDPQRLLAALAPQLKNLLVLLIDCLDHAQHFHSFVIVCYHDITKYEQQCTFAIVQIYFYKSYCYNVFFA